MKDMTHSKGQFLLIWIIFGMSCIFAFQQTMYLLNEAYINLGVLLDIQPNYLKYSKFFVYSILTILLIVISIRILVKKTTINYEPNYSKLRKYLLIVIGIAMTFKICEHFLMIYRVDIFDKYLQRHNTEFIDIFDELFLYPSLFYVGLYVYFIVLFFLLTRKNK